MPEEFKPQYSFTDDRLNELKQLFPEAWEDGVFNVDTLKDLIGEYSTDNNTKEHFGLNWVGKQDARKIAAKPPTGTLKPCFGEGVNEDNTENIFIEGENLEVLKILRKSYMGKIKMIYIDPPYNTGNDFIYNDTFADSTEDYLRKTGEKSDEGLLVSNPKSSGKYHANWLTFMYPRLRLAKDLLKEDGVIFISIGKEEVSNLKLSVDEIFGEENFLGLVSRITKRGGNAGDFFSPSVDYILCYGKNSGETKEFREKLKTSISDSYKLEDDTGKYKWRNWYDSSLSLERSRNAYYGIKAPNGKTIYPPNGSRWRNVKSTFDEKLAANEIEFREQESPHLLENGDSAGWAVYYKLRLGNKLKDGGVSDDIFEFFLNSDGTKSLTELGLSFDFSKPPSLIKKLIELSTYKNSHSNEIIMDFFGGSGSTAEATYRFNSENNSSTNVSYILVQIKEKSNTKSDTFKNGFNYISELTKERIKRTINFVDVLKGFKVFKQNTSTIYKWQDFNAEQDGALPDLFSKMELVYKNPLQDGVTSQDFITEVILQEGFPLTAKQEEVFSGIYKITHEWVPYTLYATMLYNFKNTDFSILNLGETDHFVCLDKAFEGNDALKQQLDNQCKLYTI